jgi:endo-1,4-beta-xylanase
VRTKLLQTFALAVVFGVAGCSASADSDPGPPHQGSGGDTHGNSNGGTGGGNTGSGGSNVPGNGGSGTGGSGTGGSIVNGSGGNNQGGSSGGTTNGSGGAGSGGRGDGGMFPNNKGGGGGTTSTGTGGMNNNSKGGNTSGGGSGGMFTQGKGGAGGDKSGGGGGSGGSLGSGGTGSGGKTGAAGSGAGGSNGQGGGVSTNCTEGQKSFTNNAIGEHCGYTYEYWKDNGTGTLTVKPDGFSVNWSNIGNLLGRKGIRPGNGNLVVSYEAQYNPSGNSYLCVYGWTRNPLVEYYIVDSWGSWKPPGANSIGTVTTDGGTYDIYKTQRVQQPSIDGTQTFYQYWSVRQSKRTSGTITIANHFAAWASKGMNMGSFYEVSMTVEGYQSSGTADVKMSIK